MVNSINNRLKQLFHIPVIFGLVQIPTGLLLVIILSLTSYSNAQPCKIFYNPYPDINELSITSDDCVLEGKHIWINNEIQTLNPDFSGIGSISKIYSPPLNLSPFGMEVKFFGEKAKVEYYTWKPGEIIEEASMNEINIKCLIVPVFPYKKIVQVIELSNPTKEKIIVPVSVSATPSLSSYNSRWSYGPMNAVKKATFKKSQLKSTLYFETEDGEIKIKSGDAGFIKTASELKREILLEPKSKKYFTLVISYKGKENSEMSEDMIVEKLISQSRKRWIERIEYAYNHLGKIKSSNPELDMFYKRGILTLLTCEWNKKEMLLRPYFSESGIDGGAVCSYMWGLAYVSKIMPLYNPQAWKAQIKQAIKTDAKNHYAFIPLTGESIGPWYSYNQYSMVRIIYDYILISGDNTFLNEKVNDKKVIDYCIEQALYRDNIDDKVRLINYGTNKNLLELKKTGTYQFFVPSPNAERCWSYRAVDKLCHLAGIKSLNLSGRADSLATLIRKELWSVEKKWFMTKDTVGEKHFSPSIQIFDMLRCGVLNKTQENKILDHLNEKEFLSEYGVHSISKEYRGYDSTDIDWGGPGVYAGDAPELIEDLYLSEHYKKAQGILKRILWWGKHLPYYPQAIIADKIDYRRNGRANVLAGVTSTQSVLFGILGLKFSSEGEISFKPCKTDLFIDLQLKEILINGKSVNVSVHENNFSVTIDGKETKSKNKANTIYIF
jgi:hypothetical protein